MKPAHAKRMHNLQDPVPYIVLPLEDTRTLKHIINISDFHLATCFSAQTAE